MNIRSASVATVLLLLLHSQVATGQTRDTAPVEFDRFSVHVGGGTLLNAGGQTVAAAFGFSPLAGLDLVVNVERDQVPFRRETFSDGGFSVTRGGTLTLVSGEVRASLFPPNRVSPYALAGIGAGLSRPTVNAIFRDPVENELRAGYVGGGVHVAIRDGLSVFGDARAMLAVEGGDGIMGMLPLRAGISWRF
jgi:hypothetical protein